MILDIIFGVTVLKLETRNAKFNVEVNFFNKKTLKLKTFIQFHLFASDGILC